MTSPEWRWYEPQHAVLGSREYFTHAWGSIYVLSGTAATAIAEMPSRLRYFANEGTKPAMKQHSKSLQRLEFTLDVAIQQVHSDERWSVMSVLSHGQSALTQVLALLSLLALLIACNLVLLHHAFFWFCLRCMP